MPRRSTTAIDSFTEEEVERARRYHRPLYRLWVLDLVLDFVLLGLIAFGPVGDWLSGLVARGPWWLRTIDFTGAIVLAGFLLGLPLSFWRGYVHEREWGFSTQSRRAWLSDRLKGVAIAIVLTSAMMLGFVGLARALPRAWPALVAPGASLVVLFLSFVAPIVLEPIFNRFCPLQDAELAATLLALSQRAGVPVREVLVADASRRTRKENAYVSGLGRTRRVVLFDTLLARNDPAFTGLIVAHELGHRRMRHVLVGTVVGMAGATGSVLVLWALLRSGAVLGAVDATGPGDPRVVALVLFVAGALELLGLPLFSALSRRWETSADRFSLRLTGDSDVFVRTHHALAVANLSDLDPPRIVYLATFSHPTPPERIAAAHRWTRAEADS